MNPPQEPYPYNQPPWRRTFRAVSPDGRRIASMEKAFEIYMSGPTKGVLTVSDSIKIPDCSPAFLWSEDSRYLAVPQWKYFFRRRQRLLVADLEQSAIYASPSRYRLLQLNTFSGGIITGIDSPARRPVDITVPLSTVMGKYRRVDPPS